MDLKTIHWQHHRYLEIDAIHPNTIQPFPIHPAKRPLSGGPRYAIQTRVEMSARVSAAILPIHANLRDIFGSFNPAHPSTRFSSRAIPLSPAECFSMDFSRWSEIHPKQHLPTIPQHHTESYAHLYDAPQQSYAPHHPHHPPNPNPGLLNAPDIQHLISKYENPTPPTQFKPTAPEVGLRPPGIDPYTLNSYAPHAGFEGQGLVVPPPYAHHPQPLMPVGPVAASYYQDPSVQQNWAAKEAIRQFGANPLGYAAAIRPPNGMEQMVATNPNPMFWNRQSVHPSTNGAWKRGPKKTKVVQSAWCEVCKIDCNSQDVLNKHKSGKKHKKNMEKLQESKNAAATATPAPAPAPAPTPTTTAKPKKSVTGKKRVFSSGEKQKSAAGQVRKGAPPSEPGEDLETKKRKLMEGGAPVDSVRVCEVCNVACNSQTVFNYHLAGQKHAAQVKKQAETAAAAARGIVAAGPSAVTSA